MRQKGSITFAQNIESTLPMPLDARMMVETKADLSVASTWQVSDGVGSNVSTFFKGMLVAVTSDATPANNGLYQLQGVSISAGNWKKIATVEDIATVALDLLPSTGNSTTQAMTQKAVTDALDTKASTSALSSLNSTVGGLSGTVGQLVEDVADIGEAEIVLVTPPRDARGAQKLLTNESDGTEFYYRAAPVFARQNSSLQYGVLCGKLGVGSESTLTPVSWDPTILEIALDLYHSAYPVIASHTATSSHAVIFRNTLSFLGSTVESKSATKLAGATSPVTNRAIPVGLREEKVAAIFPVGSNYVAVGQNVLMSSSISGGAWSDKGAANLGLNTACATFLDDTLVVLKAGGLLTAKSPFTSFSTSHSGTFDIGHVAVTDGNKVYVVKKGSVDYVEYNGAVATAKTFASPVRSVILNAELKVHKILLESEVPEGDWHFYHKDDTVTIVVSEDYYQYKLEGGDWSVKFQTPPKWAAVKHSINSSKLTPVYVIGLSPFDVIHYTTNIRR